MRHLAALRLPNLTWGVLRAALPAAQLLNEGRATRARVEDTLRRMFVKYRHRKRYPQRRVHVPIVDGLSLALDMDTVEEAQASGVEVVDRSA